MRTEGRTRYGLDPDGFAERAQSELHARMPGPRFEARDELDGSQSIRSLTKDDVLAASNHVPADANLGPMGRGGLRDVRVWKRKGPDVDLAMASKSSHLLDQPKLVAHATAEKERHHTTVQHAEAQPLMQQADREHRLADQARSAGEYELDPDPRARAASGAAQHDAFGARAREDGGAPYDSAEPRADTANELRTKGIASDVVDTRMRSDISQAQPATEAMARAVKTAGRTRRPARPVAAPPRRSTRYSTAEPSWSGRRIAQNSVTDPGTGRVVLANLFCGKPGSLSVRRERSGLGR